MYALLATPQFQISPHTENNDSGHAQPYAHLHDLQRHSGHLAPDHLFPGHAHLGHQHLVGGSLAEPREVVMEQRTLVFREIALVEPDKVNSAQKYCQGNIGSGEIVSKEPVVSACRRCNKHTKKNFTYIDLVVLTFHWLNSC